MSTSGDFPDGLIQEVTPTDPKKILEDEKKKLEYEKKKLGVEIKKLEDEKEKKLEDEETKTLENRMEKRMEDEKKKLRDEIKKLEDEIKKLENRLEKRMEDEKKKLQDEIKKLEDEKKNLLDEIEKLKDEKKKRLEDKKKKLEDEIKKLEDEEKKLEDEKKKLEDEEKKLEDEIKKDDAGKSQRAVKLAGLELLDILPHSHHSDHQHDDISGDFSFKDLKMIYEALEDGIKTIRRTAHKEAPSRICGSADQTEEYTNFQEEMDNILKSVSNMKGTMAARAKANEKLDHATLQKHLQNLKKDYEGLEDLCPALSGYRATKYSAVKRQKKNKETKKQVDVTGTEIEKFIGRLFRAALPV